MKRVLVTLTVFSVVFFGASILLAGKPDMYTVEGSFLEGLVGSCGEEFEVWEDVSYVAKVKDYYNNDGEWIRTKVHWTVEGVVYNADAPDNYLPYKNSVYNDFLNNDTGEDRIAGLWALVTVPGYGNIFIDVGLLIFDAEFNIIFEAGQHQWWSSNVGGLCPFLANGD